MPLVNLHIPEAPDLRQARMGNALRPDAVRVDWRPSRFTRRYRSFSRPFVSFVVPEEIYRVNSQEAGS